MAFGSLGCRTFGRATRCVRKSRRRVLTRPVRHALPKRKEKDGRCPQELQSDADTFEEESKEIFQGEVTCALLQRNRPNRASAYYLA